MASLRREWVSVKQAQQWIETIVAHIDHGKSTLADQLLLQSGAITAREFREQLLDDMDLERERGITIKARAVAINYTLDGQDLRAEPDRHPRPRRLPLRGLAEPRGLRGGDPAGRRHAGGPGADRRQRLPGDQRRPGDRPRPEQDRHAGGAARRDPRGDRARPWGSTRARSWPSAPRRGWASPSSSARSSSGSRPPRARPDAPLRALIFDSKFDDYQGVVTYVRVVDGTLRVGQKIRLMARRDRARGPGPGPVPARTEVACDELGVGQVGYVIANIKRLSDVRIGDTITDAVPARRGGPARLPGADARSSSAASSPRRTTSSRTSGRRSRSSR